MNVHLIAEIKIPGDGWVAESATEVHKLVDKDGRLIPVRRGNIATLESPGIDIALTAILEFPSRSTLAVFAGTTQSGPPDVDRACPCHMPVLEDDLCVEPRLFDLVKHYGLLKVGRVG